VVAKRPSQPPVLAFDPHIATIIERDECSGFSHHLLACCQEVLNHRLLFAGFAAFSASSLALTVLWETVITFRMVWSNLIELRFLRHLGQPS